MVVEYLTAEQLKHLSWEEIGWGYMPPDSGILEAFSYCQEKYNPKKVLEIGYYLGHSTTYQLEIYKDASIIGIAPAEDDTDGHAKRRFDKFGIISIDPNNRKEAHTRMKNKYGDRFEWIVGTSKKTYDKISMFEFDGALVDGDHREHTATFDIKMCADFNIPWILIDNYDQSSVKSAVDNVPAYEVKKVWCYAQVYKQRYRLNKIALAELKPLLP
jgi:hypothetical protein